MKKSFLIYAISLLAALPLISCSSGSNNSHSSTKASKAKTEFSLGDFDDYFDIKSFNLATNIKELDPETLHNLKGTVTVVVKKNAVATTLKPSDIVEAGVAGFVGQDNSYPVLGGFCASQLRKIIKLKEGEEETLVISVEGEDYGKGYFPKIFSEEEKKERYDAVANNAINRIVTKIEYKSDYEY